MFPSETAILMDIARNKDSGKQLANRAMDVVSEYIGYLCDSLVRRGYMMGNRIKGYQLTPMGRGTLLEFFKENEGRVNVTACTEEKRTSVELESREWDYQVKEFIRKIH